MRLRALEVTKSCIKVSGPPSDGTAEAYLIANSVLTEMPQISSVFCASIMTNDGPMYWFSQSMIMASLCTMHKVEMHVRILSWI